MSDRNRLSSRHNESKALEDEKYLKVFKHLESVNSRNRAAFDELLRYTYNNIENTDSHTSPNDNLK